MSSIASTKEAASLPEPTRRKLANREKICSAARKLFFEKGFYGATLEQIASEAGTRRSTLYNHFRDKDEILAAIIGELLSPVQEIIRQLPGPQPSLSELNHWLLAFGELVSKEQVPTILLMQASSTVHAPEAVAEFGLNMLSCFAEHHPQFGNALHSSLQMARAQAVLRQVGWSLVHYLDEPQSGREHLSVSAEWLYQFLKADVDH